MFRASLLTLVTALVVLSGGLVGQDPKKDDKKKVEEPKKIDKKDEPAGKVKGVLPPNWKKIGLSDAQVQDIYKLQNKYKVEIDALEAKITELKATRDKEMKAVLTPEQKKRLADITTGQDK